MIITFIDTSLLQQFPLAWILISTFVVPIVTGCRIYTCVTRKLLLRRTYAHRCMAYLWSVHISASFCSFKWEINCHVLVVLILKCEGFLWLPVIDNLSFSFFLMRKQNGRVTFSSIHKNDSKRKNWTWNFPDTLTLKPFNSTWEFLWRPLTLHNT